MLRNHFYDTGQNVEIRRSAYLHITERCQLRCHGCYARAENRALIDDPVLSDLHKALYFLKNNGVVTLIISGGEPLIRDDFDEFLHLVKQFSFDKVVLLTNGLLLNKWMKDLPGVVDIVSISIDTCSDTSTSYARNLNLCDNLERAIDALADCGINTQLLVTVHAKNINQLTDFAAYSEDRGVPVSYSILSKTPGLCNHSDLYISSHDLPTLAAWLQGNGGATVQDAPLDASLFTRCNCGAGKILFSVAANGNIYPCHMLHNTDFVIGNVYREPQLTLNGEAEKTELAAFHGGLVEECSHCDYLPLCGSGCRARALAENGTIYSSDPFCELIQDYYRHVFQDIKSKIS